MLLGVRLALSTACAQAVGGDPDRVMELLLRAGVDGVELDGGLAPDLAAELIARLRMRRDELPVWSVENVCPARREGAAELCSLDREEARVALEAATETLCFAADAGAGVVALRLGEVALLKSRWPVWRRRWLRGDLDEDAQARAVRERAVRGAPHLDPARRALDRLGRVADGLGLRLGLRNPMRLIGLPTAMELRMLLADLAGAPIDPLWDIPATALLVEFGVPLEEVAAAWQGSPLVRLGEACGPVLGLGVGQGELDLPPLTRRLAETTRAVFAPWGGLDEAAVLAAVASLRALPTAPPAEAPAK